MKITTYIDESLLKRALRVTKARSQREVLESGLKNLLADIARRRFAREFDSIRLDLSLARLKKQRA
ncbi:MAG: type II toxin-antitoxin system VapB family antitoxin [Elusimicrobia bacterium]|nr:type II toxin-antitoxin system VapB family antitoxin [Elusimicrobiota bacterium]